MVNASDLSDPWWQHRYTKGIYGCTEDRGIPQYPDVLWAGDIYHYTIPSFDVLTVTLRHVEFTFNAQDSSVKKFDAFMKENEDIIINRVPATLRIIEACTVDVSLCCLWMGI